MVQLIIILLQWEFVVTTMVIFFSVHKFHVFHSRGLDLGVDKLDSHSATRNISLYIVDCRLFKSSKLVVLSNYLKLSNYQTVKFRNWKTPNFAIFKRSELLNYQNYQFFKLRKNGWFKKISLFEFASFLSSTIEQK